MNHGLGSGAFGLVNQIGGVIYGAFDLAGEVVELGLDTARMGLGALNGS
ncbi:hypothetical protein RHCRD62_30120 [Rhodococcus sp. RD6.2]|nr:hypothetical protein [Rhodococcus sp. RD6.2]CRK51456.1 hypothetical protein RHCRD62_30120 [Rhodococcus sp. RD6.2]